MPIKKLIRPLVVKEISEDGSFKGYASVFGNVDLDNEVMERGAFSKSIAEKGPRGIKMLWQHRIAEPIGFFTEVKEDATGLYVEGQLLINDDPLARRAWAHLKAGSLDGMSVGFRVIKSTYDKATDAIRLVTVDLWEVSLVTFGANPDARVNGVKTIRELESTLQDACGFSRNQARAISRDGFDGLKNARDARGGSAQLSSALDRLANSLNV